MWLAILPFQRLARWVANPDEQNQAHLLSRTKRVGHRPLPWAPKCFQTQPRAVTPPRRRCLLGSGVFALRCCGRSDLAQQHRQTEKRQPATAHVPVFNHTTTLLSCFFPGFFPSLPCAQKLLTLLFFRENNPVIMHPGQSCRPPIAPVDCTHGAGSHQNPPVATQADTDHQHPSTSRVFF